MGKYFTKTNLFKVKMDFLKKYIFNVKKHYDQGFFIVIQQTHLKN
jgi:hypothetical protein